MTSKGTLCCNTTNFQILHSSPTSLIINDSNYDFFQKKFAIVSFTGNEMQEKNSPWDYQGVADIFGLNIVIKSNDNDAQQHNSPVQPSNFFFLLATRKVVDNIVSCGRSDRVNSNIKTCINESGKHGFAGTSEHYVIQAACMNTFAKPPSKRLQHAGFPSGLLFACKCPAIILQIYRAGCGNSK